MKGAAGTYSVLVTNTAGGTNAAWEMGINYGTLAYHLATNAAGRAKGRAGSYEDMLPLSGWGYAIYSGTNLARLTNSVWSTNCWLNGVRGLSATVIGGSNGMGAQGLTTMVSPRHYLFATHMHPEGFLGAYLGTNNVIYWRRTLERADVGNDTSVGILNADLPPAVGFLPVAPTNLMDYLPTDYGSVVQGLGMNQEMKIFSQPMNFGGISFITWDSRKAVPFGLGTNWNVAIRGGDSSNPDMLLIHNQLVLVTHTYGERVGPSYASQISAINQKMHYLSVHNKVGTDYQLTQFPLTNWPVIH